jgi:hypothetical protein
MHDWPGERLASRDSRFKMEDGREAQKRFASHLAFYVFLLESAE